MTIRVVCSCGKKFHTKDRNAGKRAKCPVCGSVITIPAARTKAAQSLSNTSVEPTKTEKPSVDSKHARARARAASTNTTTAPATSADPKPLGPYDVFISHSKMDKQTAWAICASLEQRGIRCWIAPRDITPGHDWVESIMDGIAQCRIMVLVFSSNANQSKQVSNEVNEAFDNELVIIPFRIEDVAMSKKLKYYLSSPHWFDALNPPLEKHLRALGETVRALLHPQPSPAVSCPSKVPSEMASAMPAAAAPPRSTVAWVTGAAVAVIAMLVVALAWLWSNVGSEPLAQTDIRSSPNTLAEIGQPGNAARPAIADPGSRPSASDAHANADVPERPSDSPLKNQEPPGGTATADPPDVPRSRFAGEVHPPQATAGAASPQSGGAETKRPSTEDAATDTMLPSELPLSGGDLLVRSEGVSVRWKPSTAAGDLAEANQDQDPEEERGESYVLVSNCADDAGGNIGGNQAEVSFQINNQSTETVTLSQLEVQLLGIVYTSEDQIVQPLPPQIAEGIKNLTVDQDSPPIQDHADLSKVFEDPDTPAEHLRYELGQNSNSELVTPTLDEQNRLDLAFAPGKSGEAWVSVRAIDPFDLDRETGFDVVVKEKQPPIPPNSDEPYNELRSMPAAADAFEATPRMSLNDSWGFQERSVPLLVEEKKRDLGTVAFIHALGPGEVIAPCGTGDLFAETKNEVLRPNAVISFTLRLRLRTDLQWHSGGLSLDQLAGQDDPRRSLVANPPRPTAVYHLLGIRLRVNSEEGQRCDMCCDEFFTLVSTSVEDVFESSEAPERFTLTLTRGWSDERAVSIRKLIDHAIKTHHETQAFEMAELCRAVPERFDAAAVSPKCYFGDRDSAFRSAGVRTPLSDRDARPRSNLDAAFSALREHDSPFWNLIEEAIADLAQTNSTYGRKATYLQEQLQLKRRSPQPIVSTVRVH